MATRRSPDNGDSSDGPDTGSTAAESAVETAGSSTESAAATAPAATAPAAAPGKPVDTARNSEKTAPSAPEATPHPDFLARQERTRQRRERRDIQRQQQRAETAAGGQTDNRRNLPMPKVRVQININGGSAYSPIIRDRLGWPVMHREVRRPHPRTGVLTAMLVQDPNGTRTRHRSGTSLDVGRTYDLFADEAAGMLFAGYVRCVFESADMADKVPAGFITGTECIEEWLPEALRREDELVA